MRQFNTEVSFSLQCYVYLAGSVFLSRFWVSKWRLKIFAEGSGNKTSVLVREIHRLPKFFEAGTSF